MRSGQLFQKVFLLLNCLLAGFKFSRLKTSQNKCQIVAGKTGLWYVADGTEYPCASSSIFNDQGIGACGCGNESTKNIFDWQSRVYFAGVGTTLAGSTSWCSDACGTCYEIRPTGYSQEGGGTKNIKTITVLIGDYCDGDVCPKFGTNKFGYNAHFNLYDDHETKLITKLKWDNPEVFYRQVPCPQTYVNYFQDCTCSVGANSKKVASEPTNDNLDTLPLFIPNATSQPGSWMTSNNSVFNIFNNYNGVMPR
jgi:hypothetical protein